MVKFKVDDVNFNKIYPVGSIYMSINETNPSTLFGGEWERIKDTFLLACGDTYDGGSTGGEATVTLTTNQIPSHTHNTGYRSVYTPNSSATALIGYNSSASIGTASTSSTGGGQPHNNMPPYLAVFVWVRIA